MSKYTNLSATKYFNDLVSDLSKLPFSFVYDDVKYQGFDNKNFECIFKNEKSYEDLLNYEFVFSFKKEIELYLKLRHYKKYGFTEFTVYFQNLTNQNSKVIKDIKAEFIFEGENPILKGILGDHVNKYKPYKLKLTNTLTEFKSDSGRATHINFPYFNLEYGNEGSMIALGWAGTWTANFKFDGTKTYVSLSSVNNLCTYLKPKERIRTGLFVVGNYLYRNEDYATNYWRNWFVEYNLPRFNKNGEKLKPFSTCCFAGDTGLPNSDGSISENYKTWKPTLLKMLEENVKVDFRWVDAGWYIAPNGKSAQPYVSGKDWWDTVGTWKLDHYKWPNNTFLESVEYAKKEGIKTLLWFEPERVTDVDNLVKDFAYKKEWAIKIEGQNTISNNIGNIDCFTWTLGRICKTLKENKVDLYREDNNCDPRILWDYLDSKEGENRIGITECKFINAHYIMWDKIIIETQSYGGCSFVDSCASGGGRNDLESMRRGVPLLRSDADRTSSSLRLSMSSSFNKWIPFCGANTKEKAEELSATGVSDKYVWRASYLPILNVCSQFIQDKNQDFDILRFGIEEWKKINKFLLKDFYCLTPYHDENDKSGFTCFIYFDPETKEGIVLAFRQEDCELDTLKVSLPYAFSNKSLVIKDVDSLEEKIIAKELKISFKNKREAKLFMLYEK